MNARPLVAVFGAVLLGALTFAPALVRGDVARVAVRAEPPRTPTGKVFAGAAPGQVFRCSFAGLRRIDVLLVRQGDAPTPPLELELRRAPAAVELRTAPVLLRAAMHVEDEARREPQWARFEFPPIADSSGATFQFELRPADGAPLSDWSPWTSLRARFGAERPWGDRILPEPIAVDFQAMFDDLSAIGVAVDGLDAAAGPASLRLFGLPFAATSSAAPELLRVGTLGHSSPIAAGYAIFRFDPVLSARWQRFRFELELPPGARVVGNAEGASCVSFHGVGEPPAELVGQSLGGVLFDDRDLHFAAYGEEGPRANWRLLAARGARGRVLLALGAWIAAAATALALCGRADRRRGG